jgi:hypothetical protein
LPWLELIDERDSFFGTNKEAEETPSPPLLRISATMEEDFSHLALVNANPTRADEACEQEHFVERLVVGGVRLNGM